MHARVMYAVWSGVAMLCFTEISVSVGMHWRLIRIVCKHQFPSYDHIYAVKAWLLLL